MRVLRHPSYAKGYVALCADQLDEARAIFEGLLVRAEEQGDESALPSILVQLSMAEILAGDWDAAEGHASAGYAFAERAGSVRHAPRSGDVKPCSPCCVAASTKGSS